MGARAARTTHVVTAHAPLGLVGIFRAPRLSRWTRIQPKNRQRPTTSAYQTQRGASRSSAADRLELACFLCDPEQSQEEMLGILSKQLIRYVGTAWALEQLGRWP